jgi:glycosyltransferase involved in cell wall biosynthesis
MDRFARTQNHTIVSSDEVSAKASPRRLYILHKLPTPYNDMFFRALHADKNLNVQVFHLWRGSWRRPWKSELATGYPNNYMKLFLGIDWRFLKLALTDRESFFMIGDWGHFVSLALVLARSVVSAPVAFWVDTPQEQLPRPLFKKVLRRILLKFLLAQVNLIFGSGKPARRALLTMGAKPDQIVNLPFFVDIDRPLQAVKEPKVQQKARELRELVGCGISGTVFSVMGTLVEKKGQDIALKAFAQCRELTGNPVGLLLAGEGPDRKQLEQSIDELGLSNSVALLGWQEPEEMEALYLATDVVVHPARYDPFPLVILETMSWSKVIVGSDVCGSVEERVHHGVNGFSFPTENVSELTKIMRILSENPEIRTNVGRCARQTAEEWPVSEGVRIIRTQVKKSLPNRWSKKPFFGRYKIYKKLTEL